MSNRPYTERTRVNLNDAPHGTMLAINSHLTRLLGEKGLTLEEIATMVSDPAAIAKGAAGFVSAFRRQSFYIDCQEPRPAKIGEVLWHWYHETVRWNPQRIGLFVSDAQRSGRRVTGNDLRALLDREHILLNACVLDWLLAHRHLIPNEWRDVGFIIFLGTAYAGNKIRCLHWNAVHGSWEVVILSLDAACDSSWKVAVYEPIWHEQDGVIDLTVTSDGTTAEEWANERGEGIEGPSESILRSPDFRPSFGITYKVRILTGALFEDKERTVGKIHDEAVRRRLLKPNIEVACLVWRELNRIDLKRMGLQAIVAMHEPIKVRDNDLWLLGIFGCQLAHFSGNPGSRSARTDGFAFIVE